MKDDYTMGVPEVADYIGCSVSMVRKLVRTKEIPNYKLGTKLIFRKSVIDWWILTKLKEGGFYYEQWKRDVKPWH